MEHPMQHIRQFLAAVAVFGLLLTIGGQAPAAADTPLSYQQALALVDQIMSADNPDDAYESLPADVRQQLEVYGQADSEEAHVDIDQIAPTIALEDADVAGTRCWAASGYVYGQNGWGATLWKYHQTIIWCIRDGRVISGKMEKRWAETNWPGWKFVGHVGQDGTFQNNSYRHYTQGHFTYGSGGWTVQTSRPCNQLRGYGNHTAKILASCNLFA
jgi:hypothetical protein